mgnify:CR=1 FL=1
MTIQAGARMPSGSLKQLTAEGPKEITTDALFGGKTVVLFSVPGAFTPTCDAKHLPITMEEGEAYLTADMADALRATLRYCPVLANEPEGRLAAIVDFTFNLGAGRLQASTLRRRVNQRDWPGAAQELRRWVYGGGRVLPGLVIRREAETLLLF